jgi:hypothetical protein
VQSLQFDRTSAGNVASGWRRRLEKNVQDSRRRIWIEAGTTRFGSSVNSMPCGWVNVADLWADTAPVLKQFTNAGVLELEAAFNVVYTRAPLMALRNLPGSVAPALVAVARNRYSVPCEWAGHMVSTTYRSIALLPGDNIVASPRDDHPGQTN